MSSKKSKQSRRAIGWDGLHELGIEYSKSYVRRLWEADRFPRPFNLGRRSIAWWADEIDQWLEAKGQNRVKTKTKAAA